MSALYFALGVEKDGRGTSGVHAPQFDIHKDALFRGLRLMTMLAVVGTRGAMD
jgi:hypothetical protein